MANASGINSSEEYDDYTSYSEYKAGVLIWKIVPPILIILGTVGNILSIIVLTRRSIRASTTALFLTALAISDLFVLYTGLLRQWLIYLFETDLRKLSQFGCKLNIWFVYSSLDFSAWILIVVTLERVISAWLPHRARTLCTKKSAVALLITVGVFILSLNSHMLYGMVFKSTYNENGETELKKCVEINEDYGHFFNVTWAWIDFCAFCLIPFTVIVVGNSLILFKVLKSQRKVKSRVVPSVQNGTRQLAAPGHGSKQSSMTAMLFTLNVVFLLSTSPISIYNIGYPYWINGATEYEVAQLDFWWAVVNMLMYVNNSLNFLLYCLSGTKFRLEVIRIFSFFRQRPGTGNTRMATPSNYTRTKFDTPSASVSPSPRHSAIFTVNSNHNKDTNTEQNDQENQNRTATFKHSNNSLHPNDALKIAGNMAVYSGNEVKTEDQQTVTSDTSETVLLNNLDSSRKEIRNINMTDNTAAVSDNIPGDKENSVCEATGKQNNDFDIMSDKTDITEEKTNKANIILVTTHTDHKNDDEHMRNGSTNSTENQTIETKDSSV